MISNHDLDNKNALCHTAAWARQHRAQKSYEERPHPPADVVSSSAKINFSYLNRTAMDCPSFSSIARPRVTNLKMGKLCYFIISHHLFSLEEGFAPQPNLWCGFFPFSFPSQHTPAVLWHCWPDAIYGQSGGGCGLPDSYSLLGAGFIFGGEKFQSNPGGRGRRFFFRISAICFSSRSKYLWPHIFKCSRSCLRLFWR